MGVEVGVEVGDAAVAGEEEAEVAHATLKKRMAVLPFPLRLPEMRQRETSASALLNPTAGLMLERETQASLPSPHQKSRAQRTLLPDLTMLASRYWSCIRIIICLFRLLVIMSFCSIQPHRTMNTEIHVLSSCVQIDRSSGAAACTRRRRDGLITHVMRLTRGVIHSILDTYSSLSSSIAGETSWKTALEESRQ